MYAEDGRPLYDQQGNPLYDAQGKTNICWRKKKIKQK